MNNHFQGNVKLYNEEFYVNTNTGEGLDRVLKKIDPLLFKMSNSLFIPNYAPEDLKQELAIIAIEGVRSYDSTKNVKLSTFLHIHLHNKIISKIRSKNKLSNNAFSVSEDVSLPATCECGSNSFKSEVKDGIETSRECTSCDKVYKKEIRTAKKEVLFSEIGTRMSANLDEEVLFIDSVGSEDSVFGNGRAEADTLEAEASIASICDGLDDKTSKILRLISLEDYSIKDAAEEVGMSPWAANLRLKNLSRNKKIRDMLMK